MKNIFLIGLLSFLLIGCSNDDKLKVDNTISVLTSTEVELTEMIDMAKKSRDEELAKLNFIDVSDEAIANLDTAMKSKMELFKTRIQMIKSKYDESINNIQTMKDELNAALMQANSVKQQLAEGKSMEEINKNIDPSTYNVDLLDESINNQREEFEQNKEEYAAMVSMVIEKYNQTIAN